MPPASNGSCVTQLRIEYHERTCHLLQYSSGRGTPADQFPLSECGAFCIACFHAQSMWEAPLEVVMISRSF